MMTARGPVAVATPAVDPAARQRAGARRALHRYRVAQADTARLRSELARAIGDARIAGLSHRQIAWDLGVSKTTIVDWEREIR